MVESEIDRDIRDNSWAGLYLYTHWLSNGGFIEKMLQKDVG